MTPRDFCYWLQGYFEIQMPVGIPEIGVWNTIVEHLTLTITAGDRSENPFDPYVDNLWGFIQINGPRSPNKDQWKHIRVTLAGLFEKVTSEPKEPIHDAEVLLEKIREKRREELSIDGIPYPISPPICSGYDSVPKDAFCLSKESTYPIQKDDRLGRNPLK